VCVCRLEQEQRRQKEFEQKLEKQRRQEQQLEEQRRKVLEQREVCHGVSSTSDVLSVVCEMSLAALLVLERGMPWCQLNI